jgi:cathepsin B
MINKVCLIIILISLLLLSTTVPYERFRLSLTIPYIKDISISVTVRPVNTPLHPLRAPYKTNKVDDLPNFVCYNPRILSPVRDQGSCGSCWAFVTTALLSDRFCVRTRGRMNTNLSVQHLLQCFDFPKGCDGESPEDVFLWLEENGLRIVQDERIPYKQQRSSTISEGCPELNAKGISVRKNTTLSLTKYTEGTEDKKLIKANIENMKAEIANYGPIFAAINAFTDLFSHDESGGPYKPSDRASEIGGHAIIIIGYCNPGIDKRPGFENGYWIIKNCWGESWPNNSLYPGYCSFAMGDNVCGIESRAEAVEPFMKRKYPPYRKVKITDVREYLRKSNVFSD